MQVPILHTQSLEDLAKQNTNWNVNHDHPQLPSF